MLADGIMEVPMCAIALMFN